MRKFLSWLWLVCVIPVVVYHFDKGGTKQMKRERAWDELREIQALELQEDVDWRVVMDRYQLLLDKYLPKDEDRLVICEIRLAMAKAQQEALDIGGSIDTLGQLLNEVADAYGDDAQITRAVRESLGKSHYMAAWVLKQVMAPEEEWLPHAERARQIFRYLVEHENPAAFRRYEREIARNVEQMAEK
jgi:hypothetical protein